MARLWNADEVTVLIAIYRRHGLFALDDSQPLCKRFAREIRRTPSAVDRQGRNLDDYVRGRYVQHCGQLVKDLYNHFRRRKLVDLYYDANTARNRNHWRVPRF